MAKLKRNQIIFYSLMNLLLKCYTVWQNELKLKKTYHKVYLTASEEFDKLLKNINLCVWKSPSKVIELNELFHKLYFLAMRNTPHALSVYHRHVALFTLNNFTHHIFHHTHGLPQENIRVCHMCTFTNMHFFIKYLIFYFFSRYLQGIFLVYFG